MYIRVDDGNVKFASHVVRLKTQLVIDEPTDLEIQREKVCLSQSETDAYTAKLTADSLEFTIETLIWSNEQLQKVAGRTYGSRSEAIEDLQGTRPLADSERVVLLEQQLAETQNAVNFLLGI